MKIFNAILTAMLTLGAATAALAYDTKATQADLDARLAKIGVASTRGTEKAGDKQVPGLYFGERRINNNYDVVDSMRKTHSAVATIFVKDGDEFVRVSTNALTPEGKRGVGTTLAHNKAYETISKGEMYCGVIDVLGTVLDSCYNPIKGADGKIIGASYVGHKKQ